MKLTWSLNGENASSVATVRTVQMDEKTSVLIIPEATAAHAGNYTCSAENRAGVANYTATLMVNGND